MVFLPPLIATVPAYYEDTYIKTEYVETCVQIGEKYGICPELLMAIIERESSGRADARNGDCVGLMQINEAYHGNGQDLTDPEINIETGAAYLAELAAEYEDVAVVLGKYHGESRAEIRISNYTTGILERSEELERAHGK